MYTYYYCYPNNVTPNGLKQFKSDTLLTIGELANKLGQNAIIVNMD